MAVFPPSPCYTNVSFVDSPDPLTGHSYLLHTLHVFVGKRSLTCSHDDPEPSTYIFDMVSLRVCNIMRLCPVHLLLLVYAAPRSPRIYLTNRIQSNRRPGCVACYMIGSNDSGLWCQDARTPLSGGASLFQRQGQRAALSIFFKVHARQGRVTLHPTGLHEVRAPNTCSPLRSVRSAYSMSIKQFNFLFKFQIVGVTTSGVFLLSTIRKPFYVMRPRPGPASPGSSFETGPPLPAHCPYLPEAPQYFHHTDSLSTSQSTKAPLSVYSIPNLSRISNDLTLDDPWYFPFQVSLDISGIPGLLFALRSV